MSGRHTAAAAGLLVVLSLFTVAWNVGGQPVTDLMEVRNLITAREMADTGQWLIPTMNGRLRLEKPPLPTWAAATAGLGAGFRNLWALRAPTVLFALIGAMAVVLYTRRLDAAPSFAAAAGLVLLSMFLYARHARLATWDVPTHALAMAAVSAFAASAQHRRAWLAGLSGLLVAASSLSKGPMLGVLVIPWFVTAAIWNPGLVRIGLRGGSVFLATACLAGVAWPLYVYGHVPDAALAVAMQESEAWLTRHVHPFWYYAGFPLLTGAWLPVAVAVCLSPLWFRGFLARPEVRANYAWMWMSLVVLMLVPTKKERYLIPALFPLAILIAQWWEFEGRRGLTSAMRVMRLQLGAACLAGFVSLVAIAVLMRTHDVSLAEALAAGGLVALGLGACLWTRRLVNDLPTRAFLGTLLVAAGVLAAAWQLQHRLESRDLPPVDLHDVGRQHDALGLPFFVHAPDDLYLVWAVGRPLLALPTSPAQLAEVARAFAVDRFDAPAVDGPLMTVEAGWISLQPPATDAALERLRSQGVTIVVERTASHRSSGGDAPLHWSRLRLTVPGAAVGAPTLDDSARPPGRRP